MKEKRPAEAASLARKAKEWDGRRRRLRVLSLLGDGLAVALAAGIPVAFAAQLFPFPFHAAIPVGALTLLSIVMCTVLGIRKKSIAENLLTADRRLGLKERLSSAYELLGSAARHPLTALLVSDALSHSRDVRPRDVHPFKPPRRWKLLPPLLAVLAVLLLVDLGIAAPPRRAVDHQLAESGEALADLGRRLAARAGREYLPETRRFAEEMERLGNELQRGELGREEAIERLTDLADTAGDKSQEMERQAEQQPDGSQGQDQGMTSVPGLPGEDGGQEAEGYSRGEQYGGAPDGGFPPDFNSPEENGPDRTQGGPSSARSREEAESLKELQDTLEQAARGLSPSEGRPPGGDGTSEEAAAGDEGAGEDAAGPGSGSLGGEPGTEAARDDPGDGERFAGSSDEEISELRGLQGDETLEGVIRALPLAAQPRKPLRESIRDYAVQTEESIEKEEVPPDFKRYIRDYFIVIGILE